MWKKGLYVVWALCLLCTSGWALEGVPRVYFSPQDRLDRELIALIEREQESIQIAVYCFTHREIAAALQQAKKRGVVVELVVDPFSLKARSPLALLAAEGVDLFVWEYPTGKARERKPLMHDKFCVFGQGIVWTGSFNFTREGALKNRENAVVLQDESVCKRYREEFAKIRDFHSVKFPVYAQRVANKKMKKSESS